MDRGWEWTGMVEVMEVVRVVEWQGNERQSRQGATRQGVVRKGSLE